MNKILQFILKPKFSTIKFYTKRIWKRFFPDKNISCHIISKDPAIIFTQTEENIKNLLVQFQNKSLYVYLMCRWTVEAEGHRNLVKEYQRLFDTNPSHKLIVHANSPAEESILSDAGIETVRCGSNSFVDENIFKIIPEIKKDFRAIYDARLIFFKRHELAAKVSSLALITYFTKANYSEEYIEQTISMLVDAEWLNFDVEERQLKWLTQEDVCQQINRAKVGLILSRREGQNYASIQYMLCGLPVVSTQGIGGRTEFFDKDYVEIVEDSAEAVEDAVQRLIDRNIPPEYIRRRTLEKMHAFRETFIDSVQQIYDENDVQRQFADEWASVFTHKLLRKQPMRSLVKQLK